MSNGEAGRIDRMESLLEGMLGVQATMQRQLAEHMDISLQMRRELLTLTQEVREIGTQMGDIQALVRSNREILAAMRQDGTNGTEVDNG